MIQVNGIPSLVGSDANVFLCRLGIHELFDSLIKAIVLRKDDLDQQNEMTKRDSIFLSPAPAWAAQADEEEARLSARNSWSCCST
jgi:hypothetical protein